MTRDLGANVRLIRRPPECYERYKCALTTGISLTDRRGNRSRGRCSFGLLPYERSVCSFRSCVRAAYFHTGRNSVRLKGIIIHTVSVCTARAVSWTVIGERYDFPIRSLCARNVRARNVRVRSILVSMTH